MTGRRPDGDGAGGRRTFPGPRPLPSAPRMGGRPLASRAAAYFFTTFQKNASVEGITPLTSFR